MINTAEPNVSKSMKSVELSLSVLRAILIRSYLSETADKTEQCTPAILKNHHDVTTLNHRQSVMPRFITTMAVCSVSVLQIHSGGDTGTEKPRRRWRLG